MGEQQSKILVVDHEQEPLRGVASWLADVGYLPVITAQASEARRLLSTDTYDLVISDFTMPGLPGSDAMALARASDANTAVLLTISFEERDAVAPVLAQGAYGYVMKPWTRTDLLMHAAKALEHRRLMILGQEHESRVSTAVRVKTRDIMEREEEIVFRLVAALGTRSDESRQHIRRVGLNAALVAKHLGWSPDAVDDIRLAASMHDIGEIGVPDSILLKPGKLFPEEFALIKKHTEIGASLLDGSNTNMLRMATDIALCHHEKWDGSGYPRGLSGTDIPEAARIVAVVDVYDVLISERVYRPPLPEDESYSIMLANRGKYFEPRIVDCFLRLIPEIELVKGTELREEDLPIDFGDANKDSL
jgi:putative two-component system response regulator